MQRDALTKTHVKESRTEVNRETSPYDFTLPDLDGNMHSLKSFKGKVVMINFWATWCVPCVTEMPALERLYSKLKESGLEIVAISSDQKDQIPEVAKFVKENGLTFKILLDSEMTVSPKYNVAGFPETIFINREGQQIKIQDPETSIHSDRIISDKPWDSPTYTNLIKSLL